METKINQLALQLWNNRFWKELREEHFLSIKNSDGTEVYCRIFADDEETIYGIGIYESLDTYALSQPILATEMGMIFPGSCVQEGWIGLWDGEDEEEDAPDIENGDEFTFERYQNGLNSLVEKKETLQMLADIMATLVKASELLDSQLYPKGFCINRTANGSVLLSPVKQDLVQFQADFKAKVLPTDNLTALQQQSCTGQTIFMGHFISFLPEWKDDPYYPSLFYALDTENHQLLKTEIIQCPESLFSQCTAFLYRFAEEYGKPSTIICFNPKFSVLLTDICHKSGIRLQFTDDAKQFLTEDLLMTLATTASPSLGGSMSPPSSETVYADKPLTYKISVSLQKGCYRHMEVSANDTLADLHWYIQQIFGFDNDHAYAFFMDNKRWSDNAYYCEGIDNSYPLAEEHTLYEVLEEKKPFLYLFDFGDEWCFQCKLLSVKEKECKEPKVVKSVGEAPPQYPDYDEEDF